MPFAENFSYLNGNLELEEYKEGIYVGYRYFDSFGVKPLFPFWLLVFLIQILRFSFCSIEIDKDKIAVNVSVENIGNTFLQEEKLYRCMYHFPGQDRERIPSPGWICKDKCIKAGRKTGVKDPV